jgi:hypothetical protein
MRVDAIKVLNKRYLQNCLELVLVNSAAFIGK